MIKICSGRSLFGYPLQYMATSLTIIAWLIVVLCIVLGLLGTILPALPGAPLIFAGMFLAAWIDDFQRITGTSLLIGALLMILSLAADFIATALGAKRVGASRLAIVGATIGTLIGLFFFIPGLIIGPFVGAMAGEFLARRDIAQASRAGIGTWLGLLAGTLAKVAIAGSMVGLLIIAFLF